MTIVALEFGDCDAHCRWFPCPLPGEESLRMHEPDNHAIFYLLVILFTTAASVADADVTQQSLFKIERSKNSNIVQYDAQIESNGKLDAKKPVIVYWFRPGKEDPIRQLSWVQKRFAYGFKADLDKASDTVTLDMVADIGRPIVIFLENDSYRATILIDGADAYIKKFYIHSTGSGMATKVEYIDLFGLDVESSEERYERIVP
jgi:hypothetical protein